MLLTLLPQPTSWKTWFHYGQMCKLNGRFTQYDYGITKNFELYNSSSPPQYPISDIQTPIYIISSLQDPIATTQVFIINFAQKIENTYNFTNISGLRDVLSKSSGWNKNLWEFNSIWYESYRQCFWKTSTRTRLW